MHERLVLLFLAVLATGCSRCSSSNPPAPPRAAPAPRPEQQTGPDAKAPNHETHPARPDGCEPDETEVCVCPNGETGSRRCDARGESLGACDACPNTIRCGQAFCEMQRLEPLGISLPACCPAARPERCGIDVSFVAENHGYAAACLELDAPGTPDARCPSVEVPVPDKGAMSFAGCRTPGGACGYDVKVPDVIDLGCVEPPKKTTR